VRMVRPAKAPAGLSRTDWGFLRTSVDNLPKRAKKSNRHRGGCPFDERRELADELERVYSDAREILVWANSLGPADPYRQRYHQPAVKRLVRLLESAVGDLCAAVAASAGGLT